MQLSRRKNTLLNDQFSFRGHGADLRGFSLGRGGRESDQRRESVRIFELCEVKIPPASNTDHPSPPKIEFMDQFISRTK